MRFAGELFKPQEIQDTVAIAPTDIPSDWPSINRPNRAPANQRYDEHMKEIVPSIPARLRKA